MRHTLIIIAILGWLPASVWAQSDEATEAAEEAIENTELLDEWGSEEVWDSEEVLEDTETEASEEAAENTEEAAEETVETTEEAAEEAVEATEEATEETVETTEEVTDEAVEETVETTEEAVETTEEAVETTEEAAETVETLGDEFSGELVLDEPYESDNRSDQLGNFVIGLHIGPSVSVFSDLDAHVMPRLELGYNLPVWGRRLEPFVMLGYTPPHASGTVEDTRLPNEGEYSWEITQHEFSLAIGLLVHFLELGNFVNGYAALAPQYVFLRTKVNGESAGEPFGENLEDDGKWGFYGALGVDLVFGPGAAFFQLGVAWSDLNGTVTGDSNTGNLSPAIGYRFMF